MYERYIRTSDRSRTPAQGARPLQATMEANASSQHDAVTHATTPPSNRVSAQPNPVPQISTAQSFTLQPTAHPPMQGMPRLLSWSSYPFSHCYVGQQFPYYRLQATAQAAELATDLDFTLHQPLALALLLPAQSLSLAGASKGYVIINHCLYYVVLLARQT